ncbi:MAG: TAXI family TRAP transporter solute-binding subunit [Chromatiaceae bacterium]|nr:TAXI family TRAP transporter solute-binding subunit [Chromatiaceae bacterium]
MRSVPVAVLLLTLATAPPALASDAIPISWATATTGGGFQLFGENIAEVINSADRRLRVETLATKGSRHNLELLEAGEVDVGQVEGNAARVALDGVGRPVANLKILSVMYPNPGMFVVRGDSKYEAIEDLKGQPVAFGTRASGLRILANDVLDGLGLEPDRDFQQIILDKAAQGPKLVIEGKAAALWGAGIGWPGFVEVANAPAGGRFIPPSQEQIQRILKKHPHLQKMTVPAGTYEGQKEDIRSVGLWSVILVRPDLDDESVYRLARAIHLGHDALLSHLPQGQYTQAANTVAYVPAERLHPGAAKYYKEIGLLPASEGVVQITPLGSHDGEFCRYDRALIFEDPDGTRLLYDAGRTVAGPDDPRLGEIDVILVSHMHGDHVGDRHIREVNAGDCATPDFPVGAVPDTNSVNIALAKGATIVTGSEMPSFFAAKLTALGGSAKQSQLVRFGASRGINGVTLTTVPAAHSNGIAGAMVGGELGTLLDKTGLTAYAGPPTGYVLTFSNGLKVYLSGDTGITAEQETVVRDHYGVQLAVMNIGDTFTTGPREAAYVVNELVKPKAVIASHANEQATSEGGLLAGTRTEQFLQAVNVPAYIPLSGKTMAFDGQGRCQSGCE